MKLINLTNNQKITYRLGRAGRDRAEWDYWQDGKLFLNRNKEGKILTVCPMNAISAEYGEDDYMGNGVFMAEDWYFQIAGLD